MTTKPNQDEEEQGKQSSEARQRPEHARAVPELVRVALLHSLVGRPDEVNPRAAITEVPGLQMKIRAEQE